MYRSDGWIANWIVPLSDNTLGTSCDSQVTLPRRSTNVVRVWYSVDPRTHISDRVQYIAGSVLLVFYVCPGRVTGLSFLCLRHGRCYNGCHQTMIVSNFASNIPINPRFTNPTCIHQYHLPARIQGCTQTREGYSNDLRQHVFTGLEQNWKSDWL